MASPQKENGYTAIANELLEAIIGFPFGASELRVFLCVIRKTYGYNKKLDKISLTQFQKYTGLSRPTVVKALKLLVNTGLLVKNNGYFVQKNWELWVVNTPLLVKHGGVTGKYALTENGKPPLTHKRQKDNIQKKGNVKESLKKLRQQLKSKGIRVR